MHLLQLGLFLIILLLAGLVYSGETFEIEPNMIRGGYVDPDENTFELNAAGNTAWSEY